MPNFTSIITTYSVSDYVDRMKRKVLVVNKDYQRGDNVWPDAARSFLIESMILGYPIPKLSIREITSLTTRVTRSEIVDGQQRSKAIEAYLDDKFAISKKSEIVEARGCIFSALPDDLKTNFIQSKLSADLFIGATDDEIIELFRRINSYTMSLNPEESRHATFQGEMKWFIYHQSRESQSVFEVLGVLSVKQIARMQDAKLLAEIVFSLLNGFKTIKKKELDDLYKTYDTEFDQAAQVTSWLLSGFNTILQLPDLYNSELMKSYNFYSLILAIVHAQNAVPALAGVRPGGAGLKPLEEVEQALLELNTVLEAEDPPAGQEKLWLAANSGGVNVADKRRDRFEAFYDQIV